MRTFPILAVSALVLLRSPSSYAQQWPVQTTNAQLSAQIQAAQYNQALLMANPMIRAQIIRNQVQVQNYQRMLQSQILAHRAGMASSGFISAEQQARLQALGRQNGANPSH